jgi:hypothetical protein
MFEIVTVFKYLGTITTDQNCVYEKLRATGTRGKPAILQSRIFFLFPCGIKNINIQIFTILILPDILYGCKFASSL